MAIVEFEPILKWFRGRLGGIVYRRTHSGKISAYLSPDMSRVRWSDAQKDHRQRFREATLYASAAAADPDIRAIYVQMAIEQGKNPKRPFDVASSDYYHNGNDLLWKKHKGDQEKPLDWKMDRYHFYLTRKRPQWWKHYGKKKRRR